MADNKKYYWLKLKEDFFRDKKIKKLRSIAGGDTYTIIYLKMQLLSLKNEGKLFFENVEDSFIEEIALEIDEKIEDVKVCVLYLIKTGLIEVVDESEYVLKQTQECIGSESASAERVRRLREKQKQKALHCNALVTNCNTEIEIEKDIDIEKDVDVEKDKKETSVTNEQQMYNKCTPTTIESFPKSIIDFYEKNVGMLTPYQFELLSSYYEEGVSEDLIILAMKKAVESDKRNISYIKSILNNWQAKRITTVIEAEKESENFKKRKNNNFIEETEEEKKLRKIKELEESMKK